ncbi:MAG: diguanylate cyclase [Eubacterium sp.]|nr:diguanylate cyclase [Eubacterium sp.]
MRNDHEAFAQIAMTLANHFDSLYYVDIESGEYYEYVPLDMGADSLIPKHGEDYFAESVGTTHKYIHPEDLKSIEQVLNRAAMKKRMSELQKYSLSFRMIINGKLVHMRHIEVKCGDNRHVLCCLENLEEEYQKNKQLKINLESEKKLARRDGLTGVRNNNAFKEFTEIIDKKIKAKEAGLQFAVVMCDINDLKKINDTRGHNFGDEAIQRASRMICDIFKHSPVFRVGGDEFVVVVSDSDYERRDTLLDKLKNESYINGRSRSGPTVASGLADYDSEHDNSFADVYERADKEMYQNKISFKASKTKGEAENIEIIDEPIPDERRRLLDGMFGALYTVAGGGYVYLNDMKYDFSRWSLPLVDDFDMDSEYMYHADRFWQVHIHPEDEDVYRSAVDAVLSGDSELRSIRYRARKVDGTYVVCSTRCFVLSDKNGDPEYFGGIIIPDK